MKNTLLVSSFPKHFCAALAVSASLLLAACGGGGSGGVPSSSAPSAQFMASDTFFNQCDGGTQEKAYLRSFIDETYLWYKDVPALAPADYATPQAYFAELKTPARTASGSYVDQFHTSMPTTDFNTAMSGNGAGYGIQWLAQSTVAPRNLVVGYVEPNSPAAQAGIQRGDRLTAVDGVDFVNNNTQQGVDALNAGLSPNGQSVHSLSFNGGAAVALAPAVFSTQTVHNVNVFATAAGAQVGYFAFDSHLQKSEGELIAAINQLKANSVTALVIDLRYNGGGLLQIASQLGYMIAGPDATQGKTFERILYNDKRSASNWSMPFAAVNSKGEALPSLGLREVTFLVTHATASASESLINGLRGIDVKVNLIGDTTRGKPYGFVPQSNCGTTYLAVQFKGVNHKGEGDYVDGMPFTCLARDDFAHAVGSPEETMLKAAMWYLETGSCATAASAQMVMRASSQRYTLLRSAVQEMRVLPDIPKP